MCVCVYLNVFWIFLDGDRCLQMCVAVENLKELIRVVWGSRPGGRWNMEEKEGCFGTKAQLRSGTSLHWGCPAEIWPEPVGPGSK